MENLEIPGFQDFKIPRLLWENLEIPGFQDFKIPRTLVGES